MLFFLFLVFLIAAVIPQKFNPIVEIATPIRASTNETKAETGTHTVAAETKISDHSR